MPLGISCATRHSSPLGLAGKVHADWPDKKRNMSFATLCFDLGNLVLSLRSDPWITIDQPPLEIDT